MILEFAPPRQSLPTPLLIETSLARRPCFPAPVNPVPVIRIAPDHALDVTRELLRIAQERLVAIGAADRLDRRENRDAMAGAGALAHHEGRQDRSAGSDR